MSPPNTLIVEFQAMASPCSLQLVGGSDAAMSAAADAAMQEVHRIEHKYSRYRSDSIISRINRAAGLQAIEIDAETAGLLQFADQLWRLSDGLFDITSGVLRTVWDFKKARLPSPAALAQALARIGWDKVVLTPNAVQLLEKDMELDFGGFGKEYAADRAAAVIKSHGVQHALINLGGDLHALRDPSLIDATPWNVAIQHPRPPAGQPLTNVAGLQLAEGGLATSGDYERFFIRDGQRYCHILNPITGWPVAHFQSVSVVAPNATTAGALATIAMLKGASATQWLDAQGAAYLAINDEGEQYTQSVLPGHPQHSPSLETNP